MTGRVLNDEMYAWKADARRYLDGEKVVTGDWSMTFAARVAWLVDEMSRQVEEVERLREALGFYAVEENHRWVSHIHDPPGADDDHRKGWHTHTESLVSKDKGTRARSALAQESAPRREDQL